ncbi:Tripartite-type tricarboxylate transporter, receptor component TctC [Albimonas donghaensis]|uniref:Tripartite-type tricarboxylate transporter, receptor component TctC n=1 Tax=Albimonas donghaensis TaxID=356660 RepID=A0A1H3DQA5_9RHOB|nr:tripartite tricarboxylate transporter substrate-binding protein [Albimonas donghaensis]SDX68551.1 Tripartite-type tricarboxylate transporter, receptor component TctC [Albimonas donghaensis]
MKRYGLTTLAALAMAAFAAAPTVAEEDWPSSGDRITFVVPFNTGGSADRLARGLANHMEKELDGAAVTVMNQPGGAGAMGVAYYTQLPTDGSHFLVMQATPFLANVILQTDVPAEWSDFTVINTQWTDFPIVAVPADGRLKDFDDLIAKAKEGKGAVTAAGMSSGASYLQMLLMFDMLGIPRENVRIVTYDGGAPLRTAIAGGQVDFTFVAANGSESIRDRIRSIAVVTADDIDNWDGPKINDALAKYDVKMPLFSEYTTSVIANSAFKKEHPDRYARFVEVLKATLEREDYKAWLKENRVGGRWMGPEMSQKLTTEGFEGLKQYADLKDK